MNKIRLIFIIVFLTFSFSVFPFRSDAESTWFLAKFSSAPEIYFIKDNKRLHIKNQEMFSSLGFNWSDVKKLKSSDKGNYQRMKHIRVQDGPTVYYLTESGMKRAMINQEAFLSYEGNKWSDVVSVDEKYLSFFPDNELIRAWDGLKVYKIENGKKRWIKTSEAFNSLNLDWSKIAPVSSAELSAYPEGEEIGGNVATPTPSTTPTPTPSVTPSPTPTPTASASLTLTKSSTPGSSSTFKGASNVEGLGIVFTTGFSGEATLTNLVIRIYADDGVSSPFDSSGYGTTAANSIVSSVSLFTESGNAIKTGVNLSLVGTIGSTGGYYKAEFSGLSYKFPANSYEKFIVKANLTDTFSGTKYIAFDVLPSVDASATDFSGKSIDFSNQNTNLNLAGIPAPIVSCFQAATLSVAVDNLTPAESVVIAGTSGVEFTKYKFSADTEAMIIKGLKLYNNYGSLVGDYDDNISSVILSYPKDANGTTEEKTGIFTNGILTFVEGGVSIYIPKGGSSVLTIKANLYATSGESDTGDKPKIGLAKVSGQWSSGSTLTNEFIAEGVSSGKKFSGAGSSITVDNSGIKQMIVRKTKATISSVALASSTIIKDTNTFYKWKVSANAAGNAGWKMILFYITGTLKGSSLLITIGTDDTTTNQDGIYGIKDGASVADEKLISDLKVYNSDTTVQIAGSFFYRSRTTDADSGGYYLVFVPTEEQIVNANEGITYELRGDFAEPIGGSVVRMNIPTFSSIAATDTYDIIAGANDENAFGANYSVIPTVSFIWTDRSLSNHSAATKDWTNDYLILNLPTPTTQISK